MVNELPRNPQYYRFSGRSCPSKLGKFAGVPLLTWKNKSSKVSTSLSLTALSMETPPQGYRKSVRICLVNASKKGGADEWEDLRFAAMRELREETGVTSAEFLAEELGGISVGTFPLMF
ncbi:nudix hydrolase 26, chloroplastic-like isoform X2 [Hevea brasiliensis]|uniref:nudix hydrolase 26, chloroplastic-like isoform X2 n=1 Tax=Hevea brasiliensis TaxID=3981 RepID=UPI0025DE8B5C|nr:nudix hydrolase 26, chloroplastic-like isoform X2 [Hevea brasiliensis]